MSLAVRRVHGRDPVLLAAARSAPQYAHTRRTRRTAHHVATSIAKTPNGYVPSMRKLTGIAHRAAHSSAGPMFVQRDPAFSPQRGQSGTGFTRSLRMPALARRHETQQLAVRVVGDHVQVTVGSE